MATYNLTSCSQDAFEDCYYRGNVNGVFVKNVEAGDTIVLPAGSATWGASSRANEGVIYIILGITVKGQGDSTVITMDETGKTYANGVIALWAENIVWRDMKIKGAGDLPVTTFNIGANNIRISNITYEGQADSIPNNGQQGDGYFVFNQGYTNILIDHCRISSQLGSHEWIFSRGPSNAWQQTNTLGTSNVDIVVEDCVFSGTGYSDANANGRHVFRFNTINGNIKFDAHGMASNWPARSFRHVEYYNNTWTSASMTTAAAMEIRGGSGMVFNNTSTTGLIYLTDYTIGTVWPNSATISYGQGDILVTQARTGVCNVNTPVDHPFQTGMAVVIIPFGGGKIPSGAYTCTRIDARNYEIPLTITNSETVAHLGLNKTPYNYPLFDQVGNGKDNAAREPMYVWGNTQGGGSWARSLMGVPQSAIDTYRVQMADANATFTERDVIGPNRDFFATSGFDTATGMQVGTRAQMDAYTPSVTGYGWWVTDEGSWNTTLPANTSGRLYRWNGSAWVLYYTPYTYPHPMQTATECATPVPSVAAGTYEYAQSVTLALNPSDSTCRYTTNGTDPTQSNGTIYTGSAISISSTTQLKAIAYKTGLNDSPILDATYTITNQVATPTSNRITADYHGTQSVTLATSTSGAVVHYTLDGSTPTAASPTYSSPLSISTTTTIKAIGVKDGLSDSAVLTIGITILLEVGNWNVVSTSQLGVGAGSRTGYAYFTAPVSGSLSQISIYGTNTSAAQDIEFGLYSDDTPPNVAGLTKVTGGTASFTDVGTWASEWKTFTVDFPVETGKSYWIFCGVSNGSSLTVTANYSGAIYGRWGGPPESFGAAWPSSYSHTSNVDGWEFNFKGLITDDTTPSVASAPSFSISSGTYYGTQSVSLSTSTAGATIRYTTNGDTPTSTSGTVYTGDITVSSSQTIKAIAYKNGFTDSSVSSAVYTILKPPTIIYVSDLTATTLTL